jgi:hypothetical protein
MTKVSSLEDVYQIEHEAFCANIERGRLESRVFRILIQLLYLPQLVPTRLQILRARSEVGCSASSVSPTLARLNVKVKRSYQYLETIGIASFPYFNPVSLSASVGTNPASNIAR